MTHPTLARLMAQTARLLKDGAADRWLAPEALQRAQAQAAELMRAVQASGAPGGVYPPAAAAGPAGAPAADVIDVSARVVPDDEAGSTPAPVAPPADASAAAATTSTGPAAARSPARWIDGRFEHRVRTVEYRLHVPAGADDAGAAPRPLLLMLHGCTQDARDFATGTAMHEVAPDAFVLYPVQSARANPQRCWNWFKHSHQQRGRGEAALLADLVAHIAATQAVDARRVAVAGLSAGGAMAAVLGQAYPERFSAVGVHSGLPAGVAADLPSALAAMRSGPGAGAAAGPAVPTIAIHGDADTTVHPANGVLPGADRAAAERATSPHGMAYTRRRIAGADGAPRHEQWVVHGAGHAWSGGAAAGSYTLPAGPGASAAMWDVFRRTWAAAGR